MYPHGCASQVMDGSLYVSSDLAPPPPFQSSAEAVASHQPLHISSRLPATVGAAQPRIGGSQDPETEIDRQIQQGTPTYAPRSHKHQIQM
jgi:hypothetical protein